MHGIDPTRPPSASTSSRVAAASRDLAERDSQTRHPRRVQPQHPPGLGQCTVTRPPSASATSAIVARSAATQAAWDQRFGPAHVVLVFPNGGPALLSTIRGRSSTAFPASTASIRRLNRINTHQSVYKSALFSSLRPDPVSLELVPARNL